MMKKDSNKPNWKGGPLEIHVGTMGNWRRKWNYFVAKISNKLEKKFFRLAHRKIFLILPFTGIELTQHGDSQHISMSQSKLCEKDQKPFQLNPIAKTQLEISCRWNQKRLFITSISRKAYNMLPLTRDLEPFSSKIITFCNHQFKQGPQFETLMEGKSSIARKPRKYHDVNHQQSKPHSTSKIFRFLAFFRLHHFSSPSKPDSHAGSIICGETHQEYQ